MSLSTILNPFLVNPFLFNHFLIKAIEFDDILNFPKASINFHVILPNFQTIFLKF